MSKKRYYKKHHAIVKGVEQEIGRHRKWMGYKYYGSETKRLTYTKLPNW